MTAFGIPRIREFVRAEPVMGHKQAFGEGDCMPPRSGAFRKSGYASRPLAGCGKSRDFGKTVMKRARNGNPGLIKSTGYEGAKGDKGDESGWKHHRPTFSAAC